MKNQVHAWWGRTIALSLLASGGLSAIALPSQANVSGVPFSPRAEITMAMSTSALEQTVWQLVSYRDASGATVTAWDDNPATMQFQAGQVTGTTGCNRFFSAYTLTGDELAIAPGGSTLMACFPDALVEQETAIFTGMAVVTGYDLNADELQLLDRDGDVVFTLAPQRSAALINTDWTLTAYNNGRDALVTPVLDTTITATFDDAGLLSGSAGCNTYRAHFEYTDDTLQIGDAASTRRLCQLPDGTMEQEQTFLNLLTDVSGYEIAGDQLTLFNAAGTTLAQFSTTM